MSKRDYYEILGVSKSSSDAELKAAYRKLAFKYHPDQSKGEKDAENKFKEISEAYDTLKDPQKRAAYDRFGHAASGASGGGSSGGFHNQAGGFGDFNDIFGDIFGDMMGGQRGGSRKKSTSERGSDLKYNFTISLEDAFNGIEREISFNTFVKCQPCDGLGTKDSTGVKTCGTCNGRGSTRMQQGFFAVEQTCYECSGSGSVIKNPCNKCNGQGRNSENKKLKVSIPKGIESNTRIRLSEEGEAGLRGGSSGDLYIYVSVTEHPMFKVDKSDLHIAVNLSFVTAILGGEVNIPTIDGGEIKLKIPVGTQHDDRLKIKSYGMNKVRSSVRGDMYAHIKIQIPKNVSSKQKELLEEFSKESKLDEGFINKVKNFWSGK
jgi:molecular chaperone DnaJ